MNAFDFKKIKAMLADKGIKSLKPSASKTGIKLPKKKPGVKNSVGKVKL